MAHFSRARLGRRSAALALGLTLLLQSGASMAQPTGDLVIHNGLIINATGRMAADIRISGEKIVEMRLLDPTLNRLNHSGFTVKSSFDIKPGTYLVRLVVRDAEGSQMAARNGAVVIPN